MAYRVLREGQVDDWQRRFYDINVEWLKAHFSVTPADENQLRNVGQIPAEGGAVLFVLDEDEVVGAVALVREPDGDVEIAKMGVLAAHRGKGAGRALLAEAIREARKLTRKVIYLETVEVLIPAIRLYESAGFFRTGEVHVHPLFGRTTFRMELKD